MPSCWLEKNSDRSTNAPNSATDAAAITSWPKSVTVSPASLSGTMMTLSDVATTITAISTGDSDRPAAEASPPTPNPSTQEIAKPPSARRMLRPRRRSRSISIPARKSSIARPTSEKTCSAPSTCAQPRRWGPTATPNRISSTMLGTSRHGASARSTGAAKAISATRMKES